MSKRNIIISVVLACLLVTGAGFGAFYYWGTHHLDSVVPGKVYQYSSTLNGEVNKGTLPSDLYSGSTFSITNLGGPGVEYFTPILNSPEVAILGVGATQQALAFNEEGEVVQKDYLPLSLSFDHQIIDGLPAAEFLAQVISYLEDPYLLIF